MTKLNYLFYFLLLSSVNLGNAKFFKEPAFIPSTYPKVTVANNQKLPIVFHDNYDIGFWGIEKLHAFDSKKYGKVKKYLQAKFRLSNNSFHQPDIISDKDLKLVHSNRYLKSLNQSATIANITELALLKWTPNFILQRAILKPMRLATAGTVLGAELALKHGWAINLSGGYHHAKSDSGGGFCIFADIPLAIKKLRINNPNLKVLVIDLDAHQGNGHEAILANDPNSFIFDVYVEHNYPYDMQVRKHIHFNYPVKAFIQDAEYLDLIKAELPKALEKVKPDLIIYNAGTDVFEKDPLGRMSITKEGIKNRDFIVFSEAQKRNMPILMVLSGGYTKESSQIIAESISQILEKYINCQVLALFP